MKTFLVTGGSGYLAGWLIVALLKQDHAVRTTLRNRNREQDLRAAISRHAGDGRLSVVIADLLEDAGWDEATQGLDGVFHVASPMSGADMVAAAREGTRRVLESAHRNGVPHVVLTSSARAAKPSSNKALLTDETVWAETGTKGTPKYTIAKTLAERDAWAFAENHPELALTTILPGFMLGPLLGKEVSPSVSMIQQMLSGAIRAVPRLSFPIVDVRDLADLQIRAMGNPAARGQRFIGAGETVTMLEMARLLRAQFGEAASKAPKSEMPDLLVRAAALANSFLREMLPELGLRRTYSAQKAADLLDWHPSPAAETIRATGESILALTAGPETLTQRSRTA